jgi:ariadne-1
MQAHFSIRGMNPSSSELFDDGSYAEDDESFVYQDSDACIDDGFAVETHEAAVSDTSYTQAEVLQSVHDSAAHVMAVLSWHRTPAMLLLRHFKWNLAELQEKYFDRPEHVVAASKVSNCDDALNRNAAEAECGMCYDDVVAGAALTMSCAHTFCDSCWGAHLAYHLSHRGKDSIAVQCPDQSCRAFCGATAFQQLFGSDSKELRQYHKFLVDAFVDEHEHYTPCPAPGCELVTKLPVARSTLADMPSKAVHCLCGQDFCFKCGSVEHSPSTCEHLRKWRIKEKDDSETANWVAANTKPCPKCHKVTEKNGGCNHITCSQCQWGWCWVCEGPWSEHGSSYYKCNQFKQEKPDADQRKNATNELARYIHYYSRYRNHEKSQKLDNEILAKAQKTIADGLVGTSKSLAEIDYIAHTAKTLLRCRRVLMYAYIYAFYLEEAGPKELFEYNQAMLEHSTELLSEFVDAPEGKFTRQEVINRTGTAENMLKRLQEGCIDPSRH